MFRFQARQYLATPRFVTQNKGRTEWGGPSIFIQRHMSPVK